VQTGQGLSPLTSQSAAEKRTVHPCNTNTTYEVKSLPLTAASGFTYAIWAIVIFYNYSFKGTLMMVTKVTEICRWILMYDKAYFMSVLLLVYYILCKCEYSLMQGYGTYKHHNLYQYVCDIWPHSLWHGIVNKKKEEAWFCFAHKGPQTKQSAWSLPKILTIFITTFTKAYQHTIIEPYKSSPQTKPHIYKIKNLYLCALRLN